MQYCVNGNPDEIYFREITATDHINKGLAQAYLKHIQENPPSSDEEISSEEEWDDPEGQTYMDSRPEDAEDNHVYLRADDNIEEEQQQKEEDHQ